MIALLDRVRLPARRGRNRARESIEPTQHGKMKRMNWDMVIPTLLYCALIAVGLITYIIVGLGHH